MAVSSIRTPLRHRPTLSVRSSQSAGAKRCRQKFMRMFPDGFYDETYVAWERAYKWDAHLAWSDHLSERNFARLLRERDFEEIALRAVRIESRTNLLFSFEKMALRDALRSKAGAREFSTGLYAFIHGTGNLEERFEEWVRVVAELPRKQTRVLTWPLVTVFGFIARPKEHNFLKPNVTRCAALQYGFDFRYTSRPNFETYANYLDLSATVRRDLKDLRPRDLIDVQSFLWVQGSDEYEE